MLVILDGIRITSGYWVSLDNLHGRGWSWLSKSDDEMAPVMIVLVLAVNTGGVINQVVLWSKCHVL